MSQRGRQILSGALLLECSFGATSCTVVKPVVCAFAFPVHVFKEVLADDGEESSSEESYKRTPGVLAIPTVIAVGPLILATASVAGAVGGLTSGIASDLNLLLGNARMDKTGESLKYPFRTNVQEEKKD